MNARNNRWLVALIAVTALGAASCNPFPGATKGAPQIIRVLGFDSAPGDGQDDPTIIDAAGAGGNWLIFNAPQGSYGATYAGAARPGKRVGLAVEVQFNKQLDGASIQATPDNCIAKAGVFTITPAPVATETWYACYNPGNPDPTVGSTVLFWKSQITPSSRANDPRVAVYEPAIDYHITGSVKDQEGNPIPIDVTFKVSGERIDGPTVTDANPVVVTWPAADGGAGAVTYDVERAGNFNNGFNDSPTTFTQLAAGVTSPYTDNTVVSGNKYWYRITSHYAQNGTFATGAPSMATVP